MNVIERRVSPDDLGLMAAGMFGNMIMAVVDVDREVLAVDGELHSDLEALLIENGSKLQSLWGSNFYPEMNRISPMPFERIRSDSGAAAGMLRVDPIGDPIRLDPGFRRPMGEK